MYDVSTHRIESRPYVSNALTAVPDDTYLCAKAVLASTALKPPEPDGAVVDGGQVTVTSDLAFRDRVTPRTWLARLGLEVLPMSLALELPLNMV